MMFEYIEIRGSNSIEGSCFPPVELDSQMKFLHSESPVPEPLDSEVNISDDSWISAKSELDNSSGDSIYTDTCEQFLSGGDDSESPAPQPLDLLVNISDDSWISAASDFDNSIGDSIYADTCEDDSESPVPEPLDSEVNTSSDSCESWISAESEFDNSNGDLMDTSQSCVNTWCFPLKFHNDRLVHL